MFSKNSVYIIGISKSQLNNPITYQYSRFVMCFIVDKDSGIILACSSTTVMQATDQFLQSIFVGKSMLTDVNLIKEEIESRYFGASQKAIVVAWRDAQRRFQNLLKGSTDGITDFNWD